MGYTKSRSKSRTGSRASTLESKDRLKLDPLMHHRQVFVLSLRRSMSSQGNCNWSDVRHHYKKASGRALNGEELNWLVNTMGKTKMDIFQGELSDLLRVVDSHGNVICPNLKNSSTFVNQNSKITNQLEVENFNDDTPSISEISPNPSMESETGEEIDVVGGMDEPESNGDSAIQSGSEDGNSIDRESLIQITVDAPVEENKEDNVEIHVDIEKVNSIQNLITEVEHVNVQRLAQDNAGKPMKLDEPNFEEVVVEIETKGAESSLSIEHQIPVIIEYSDTLKTEAQQMDFIDQSKKPESDVIEAEDVETESIQSEIIEIPIEIVDVQKNEEADHGEKFEAFDREILVEFPDLPIVHASPAVVIEAVEIPDFNQQQTSATIEEEIKEMTDESEELYKKNGRKVEEAETETKLSTEVFQEFVKIYEQQEANKQQLREIQWIAEQLKKEVDRCLSPAPLVEKEENNVDKNSETDVSLVVCTTPSTLGNISEAESAQTLDTLSPTPELPLVNLELDPGVQLPIKLDRSRRAKKAERAKSPRISRCTII